MGTKKLFILMSIILLSVTNILAQTRSAEKLYQEGQNCFNGTNGVSMNREKAYELWLKAAQMGHAFAQGKCGENVNLSNEERVSWARKSAEQKCKLGFILLGEWYEKGEMGLPKDDVQSVYWDKRWAETGDAVGEYVYALDFLEGRGMPQRNVREGITWLENAANKNYIDAILQLICLYDEGRTQFETTILCSKNYEKYMYWLRKGAELGNAVCQYKLGYELFANPTDNLDDPDQSVIWFKKAAEQGIAESYYFIGSYYYIILEDNYAEAELWLRKGCELEAHNSQWLLSDMIRTGKVQEKYTGEREELLLKAAQSGFKNAIADYALLEIYKGQYQSGLSTLEKLLAENNDRAMAHYGALCILGINGYKKFKKNKELGIRLLFEAMNEGQPVVREYVAIPEIGNIKPSDLK